MLSLSWKRLWTMRGFHSHSYLLYSNKRYYQREKETEKDYTVDEDNKKIERALALEERLPGEGRGTKAQNHFGTNESPRKVPSLDDSRFVGCTGKSAPKDHPIWWLHVSKDSKVSCPLCGQVFQLEKVQTES